MEGAPVNDGYRGPQGHDPYQDPYARGHDPYGRQGYDYDQQGAPQDPGGQGYRDQSGGYGYDYDPYAQQPPPPQQHAPYPAQAPHPRAQQQHYAPHAPPPAVGYDYDYDPYGPAAHSGEQPVTPVPPDGEWGRIPQQRPPGEPPGQGRPPHEPPDYATEQFSFVEDETESSEDVIDWLKFTESRTERREEAKRRGRNRRVALLVVMVLAALGGTGYLWATDRLPFVGGESAPAAAGEEKRDTLVVHLHDTDGGPSATALLVNNATTGKGTTVLLPNDLAVSGDDGTATTLGQAVDEQGAGATRDAIDGLLGSQIKGSWRLDTPYLEILVEGVGGITVDADATVPGAKKGDDPLVEKGQKRSLNGEAAIAYATHHTDGEPQTAQLQRFGQVMQAVLKKLPSDTAGAKNLVKSMGMVLDPSLSEAELAASLASLSELAKEGAYATEALEIGDDGRPSEQATQKVVEDVLGGTVKSPEGAAAARVSVQNGAGSAKPAETAKVALVNGGFTFVDGGRAAEPAAASEVRYADAAAKEQAVQVAKTLGLPEKAVAKGRTPANADVVVVLGQDYEG